MKKKTAKPSTPETLEIGDILPKDAEAVEVFLFLTQIDCDTGGRFAIQFDPKFLQDLAKEIQALLDLRDRVLV